MISAYAEYLSKSATVAREASETCSPIVYEVHTLQIVAASRKKISFISGLYQNVVGIVT